MKSVMLLIICGILGGCAQLPSFYVQTPAPYSVYEPSPYIGGYYIGQYEANRGYWDGHRWDRDFYHRGHPGWGHYYHDAPRSAWPTYRNRFHPHPDRAWHHQRWHREHE